MAFNHVGNCSCPVGDCDCGVDYSKLDRDRLVYAFLEELIPKEVFMFTISGEIWLTNYKKEVDPKTIYVKDAVTYIGRLDTMNQHEADAALFKLHAFMVENNILYYSNGAEYMKRLIYWLGMAGFDEKSLRDKISILYKRETTLL